SSRAARVAAATARSVRCRSGSGLRKDDMAGDDATVADDGHPGFTGHHETARPPMVYTTDTHPRLRLRARRFPMRRFTPTTLWMIIVVVVVLTFGTAAAPVSATDRATPDLVVYTNNIENLLTKGEKCQGDWDELIYYIAERPRPNLILLQQV